VLALCGILKEADACFTKCLASWKEVLIKAASETRMRALINPVLVKFRLEAFKAVVDIVD